MLDIRDQIKAEVPGFSFNDYVRQLKPLEAASGSGKTLRVAVLRSYTVEPIEPILRVHLLLEGFQPELWFGGYDQYTQEILDGQSELYRFVPDLVLLLTRLEEVLPDFVENFPSRPHAEWAELVQARARELAALAGRVVTARAAQVIVQNMALPRSAYFGVFDSQRSNSQLHLVHLFNQTLVAALQETAGAFVWDFDGLVRATGYDTLLDPKMWYVSRNPYRQSVYPAIGRDLMRYVASALGRVKKCIVVDLDDTLWGGVVGEDGLEGIRLGHSYPGNCFRDFQKELLKLHHRGILLAINSKNNPDEALRVIDEHPDMVLRRRHFAAIQINWRDKATNLREIARDLNIGLDSLIFLDDNPVECELIRRECPECDVVTLSQPPYLRPGIPAALPGIENIRLTDEDRSKGEMYQMRTARKAQEEHHANLDDFLRSLAIVARIEAATPFSIPRIAQLTANQLNMTTRRYTEPQVQALVTDPNWSVYAVSSRDRFGDYGIIGVVMLRFCSDECIIDTLLLSCRVIGRGIEQLIIAFIADVARSKGARHLVGEFFPTAKNGPAAGVYARNGFEPVDESRFHADLLQTSFPYPSHIEFAPADTVADAR
jgi:FkbH-like protein